MKFDLDTIGGLKVTIMGLGLHGGGLAAARFFAGHGAEVTVTDLRGKEVLAESVRGLDEYSIRYVLGGHDFSDFRQADLVIKNPGVPPDSPYLEAAAWVETDISVFLRLVSAPIIAVTGTKGKSTTVTAVHHVLSGSMPGVLLGGNITVSPLTFLDKLLSLPHPLPPVVLELSSWQLGDLKGRNVLKPRIAAVTNLLWDHQDRYGRFEEYAEDKAVILEGQSSEDTAILNCGDEWFPWFSRRCRGRLLGFSGSSLPPDIRGARLGPDGCGYVSIGDRPEEKILGPETTVPGFHNKLNLLCAGLICTAYGLTAEAVRERLMTFPGVPHRLEAVENSLGFAVYNDSAATIPDAVLEAVKSFSRPVVLITGGTDKNLDFSPYRDIAGYPESIVLLEGTATRKIVKVLEEAGKSYYGPFGNLEAAVGEALKMAPPGGTVLFSPGCASFGMFKNEFDRGNQFKALIRAGA